MELAGFCVEFQLQVSSIVGHQDTVSGKCLVLSNSCQVEDPIADFGRLRLNRG